MVNRSQERRWRRLDEFEADDAAGPVVAVPGGEAEPGPLVGAGPVVGAPVGEADDPFGEAGRLAGPVVGAGPLVGEPGGEAEPGADDDPEEDSPMGGGAESGDVEEADVVNLRAGRFVFRVTGADGVVPGGSAICIRAEPLEDGDVVIAIATTQFSVSVFVERAGLRVGPVRDVMEGA